MWWSRLSWIYLSIISAFNFFSLEKPNSHSGSSSTTGRVVSKRLDSWDGVSVLLIKKMKEVLLDLRQLPAFPGWQSWNVRSQKGLFYRSSRLVYKTELSAASRRGLAPREAALLLGLPAPPRSGGKYFGRDRHLSLNLSLDSAILGSSPHYFWSIWHTLGASS